MDGMDVPKTTNNEKGAASRIDKLFARCPIFAIRPSETVEIIIYLVSHVSQVCTTDCFGKYACCQRTERRSFTNLHKSRQTAQPLIVFLQHINLMLSR